MTIQQHASFDSSAAELNATSKLVKAWESKNAKNAAKVGGVSLMALSLAACGGSSTTTTDSSSGSGSGTGSGSNTASTSVTLANNGGTYSLSTTVDGVSAPAAASAKIYLNDNEPGDAYAFTLDASAAGSGALVIEFADAGDTATLAADSSFGNFTSLEVKNGTVDVTAMTLPTGLTSATVNSGLKLTATQVQQITSVSGTGDFTVVATTQVEIDAVIAHFAANDISVSTKISAASGSTLTADDITAANTNVAAEVASNTATVTTTTVLTTKLDSGSAFTGGSGADGYTGTLTFASDAIADSATLTAGDTVDGGDGTDSVTITVTGAAVTNAGEVVTPTFTNIEKIHVRSFETDASGVTGAGATIQQDSVEIDLSNSTGYTEIGTTATNNAEADVVFANVAGLPSIVMAGKGDLRIENTTASVASVTDTVSVTLNGVGASKTAMSSLNINGVETVNITSATAANFLTLEDAAYTEVTVAGDQNLRIDVKDTGVTSFNASTATGDLHVDLADITLANLTSVKGGAGSSDTLVIDEAVTVDKTPTNTLSKVSGFETLAVEGTTAITLSTDTAGINDFDFTDAGNQTLTLNSGFEGAVSVSIKGDSTNADVISNSANVALTVTANAADLDGTITGGTGADTLNVTADGGTRTVASTITNVDTIKIVAATDPSTVVGLTMDNANVAADKSMTVDASALTDSSAVFTFDGSAETDGTYTVTGGAGKDDLTAGAKGDTLSGGDNDDSLTGGAGDDTLDGGAGKDTITMNAGKDTVTGGDGKDTIIAGGNLTKDDSIDGGAGEDTLRVTSVDADGLAGVQNVENLQISGGASVSLSKDLSFTTIDLTNGNTTEAITLAAGYTAATTFKVDSGDDITNTGADAVITIEANADELEAADDTLITGSDKAGVTNTLVVTNNAAATVDLGTDISGIDVVTVKDSTVTDGIDITFNLASYASAVSIDVSELDTGEDSTISGTSAKAITYVGGAGVDTVILSSDGTAADDINLGAGKDVITAGTNHGYNDKIDGGAGDDTIAASAAVDVDFQNTSSVETLNATGTATLGSFAQAAGIRTVKADGTNKVDVSTMTADMTIHAAEGATSEVLVGGLGADTFVYNDNDLVAADDITGGAGDDTVRLDNDNSDAGTVGNAVTAIVDKLTTIEKITVNDVATDNSAGDVTLTVSNGAGAEAANYDLTTLTVDASSMDAGEKFTFNASLNTATDEAFTVTGGAEGDSISTGAGADTIVGGGGGDYIDAGAGKDALTGGAGSDVFFFDEGDSTSAKKDSIADFTTTKDSIILNITGATAGAQSISVVDTGDADTLNDGLSLLSSKQGEFYFDKAQSQLVVDVDGNGLIQASDMLVTFTGLTGFAIADVNANVTGGSGVDTVVTGDGNDEVHAAAGADVVTTGKGDDLVSHTDFSSAGTKIDMGAGTDTLFINDTTGGDLTNMHASLDDLEDEAGIEQVLIKAGATVTLDTATLSGDALIFNTNAAGNATLALGTLATSALDLSSFTFTAFSYGGARETAATGVALGNDANDLFTMTGGAGATVVTGSSITDQFTAGHASNKFDGKAGDDIFVSAGNNVAEAKGGAGTSDTFRVSSSDADMTAVTISGFEIIDLSANGMDLSIDTADLSLNAISSVVGSTAAGASVEQLKIVGTNAAVDTINLSGITTATTAAIHIDAGTGADVITGSSGADIFSAAQDDSSAAAIDVFNSFEVAKDVVAFATAGTTHVSNDSTAINVAAGVTGSGTVNATTSDGIATLGGADKADVDTLAEWIAVAELIVEDAMTANAAGVSMGFEFGGDTYITEWKVAGTHDTGTLENILKLDGITGITDLDTSAASNTVVIA